MKRVRCSRCDQFILFDETRYEADRSLVFVCPNCQKEFKIRLKPKQETAAAPSSAEAPRDPADGTPSGTVLPNIHGTLLDDERDPRLPYIVVVENGFGYRQELPLALGDNLIGRRNKGTEVDIPVETNDPSMDRRHCYINVRLNGQGQPVCMLRDNASNTGTFLNGDILGPKDRVRIDSGAIITLGATTIILHLPGDEE